MQAGESCVSYTNGLVQRAPWLTQSIGRLVLVVAAREVMMVFGSNPDVTWCDACGRYYNKNAPHDCRGMEIRLNREKLERWLGTFTIREDS